MHEIDKIKLSDQTKFGLSEIMGIEIIFSKRLISKNHAVKK